MSDQAGNQNVGFLMTWLKWYFQICREICPKGADGTGNSIDCNQTAPVQGPQAA